MSEAVKRAGVDDLDYQRPSRPELSRDIAVRLRAVMAYMNIKSITGFAHFIGEDRSTVSHWLNSGWVPPVPAMVELSMKTGLTLDWIYKGNSEGLPPQVAVLLSLLLEPGTLASAEAPKVSRLDLESAVRLREKAGQDERAGETA